MFFIAILETPDEKQTVEAIYAHYKYDCLYVAMRICGNKALAEDAVHNAFVEIMERKGEYLSLPCSKLRSKIVIITKNKLIDLLRKNKHLEFHSFDDDTDIPAASDSDMSLMFERAETVEKLMDCVAKLPEIYKSVLELSYVHELSYKEIAVELGVSVKTVSVRIVRAKGKLRKIIEEEGVLLD